MKVFFPNFTFTMVRSGVPRAANQVVFRVPKIMNKLDITSYLEGLYPGVKVDNVQIFNFLSKTTRQGRHYKASRKNAIVSLGNGQTFLYPPEPEADSLKFPLPDPNVYPRVHPLTARQPRDQ
jgi:ribosomal protein L23